MFDFSLDNKITGTSLLVAMSERPKIPTTEMDMEETQIDGRDGGLHEKKGYKTRDFTLSLNLLEDFNIKKQIRIIKGKLMNATTFSFSDDDVFYKIINVKIGDIENEIEEYGLFDVSFTIDPFDYLKSPKIEVLTSAGSITNPGTYFSRPSIKVFGSGESSITINKKLIKVNLQHAYQVIDSELQESYYLTTNTNALMDGAFPLLDVGKNDISWTGGITKVEVEGRWRYL